MLRLDVFEGIYLHREAVDLRKSIDGLAAIVSDEMGLDVFGPHLFLFSNKRRNKLKVLYWDATGFALWYKRLEKDRFIWPRKMEEAVIRMEAQHVEWLLRGYDVWKMQAHKKLEYGRVS